MNKTQFNNKYLFKLKSNLNIDDKKEDIKMLNNGSLLFYRYYPLTDKYTIKNILDSIIHFSDPCKFNDPFDSFVGIEMNDVIRRVLIPQFEEIFKNTILASLIPLSTIDDIDDGTANIIKNEIGLDELIVKYDNEEICEEVIFDTIFKYVMNIMKPIVNDSFEKIGLNFEEMFTLFWESNYVQNELKNIKDTGTSTLPDNIIQNMNIGLDVMSEHCKSKKEKLRFKKNKKEFSILIDDLGKKIKESFLKNYKILCLTNSYDKKLMWSHYADKHNGICVEYDFDIVSEDLVATLFPVSYSNNRPIINYRQIFDKKDELKNEILKSMLIKSKDWSYENEWRVLLPNSFLDDNYNYTSPKIKRIYFGANVTEKRYNYLVKKIKKYDSTIECIKLKLNYKNFELEKEE